MFAGEEDTAPYGCEAYQGKDEARRLGPSPAACFEEERYFSEKRQEAIYDLGNIDAEICGQHPHHSVYPAIKAAPWQA